MFKFTVWLRIAQYTKEYKIFFLETISRWIFYRLCLKYSIDFPISVKLGLGFKINHGMGLVVNSKATIGHNVDLSHSVTIATEKGGTPIIGNNVRISPGAVIIGNVVLGNNIVVGANCVVVSDVPDKSVAVGIPNKNLGRSFEEFVDRNYFPVNIL